MQIPNPWDVFEWGLFLFYFLSSNCLILEWIQHHGIYFLCRYKYCTRRVDYSPYRAPLRPRISLCALCSHKLSPRGSSSPNLSPSPPPPFPFTTTTLSFHHSIIFYFYFFLRISPGSALTKIS
ncbi:hypothetical protein L873DRAFT_831478 [Choiromyces venosus 120613-1]|uniref:Uncharacterized protein n=1 Tax=Choiromyces venosus 120613-1 TaxID=1336337 RepID=A0A3N4JTH9_9PEZI|nr:hypothetical protein L873DRAFT_831478 [Choiromyces venosus 120613-1]